MKVKLLGYSSLDFKTNDGDEIKGTKVFIAFHDDNTKGLCCTDFFIGSTRQDVILIKLDDFLGKDVIVEMNLKGKLACISAV